MHATTQPALTVCDTSQRLVEGGCVAVICQRDTNSSRKKPSGQSEGLLVLQQPAPEALIVHLVTLLTQTDTSVCGHQGGKSPAVVTEGRKGTADVC